MWVLSKSGLEHIHVSSEGNNIDSKHDHSDVLYMAIAHAISMWAKIINFFYDG
jgi:hypothetical protein